MDKIEYEDLNKLFDLALDLFCITDIEGHILNNNRSWETVLGYTKEYLSGKSYLSFIHPDDLLETTKFFSKTIGNKDKVTITNRYRSISGEYKHIEWDLNPDDNNIYIVARDVSRYKSYEDKLAKTLEDFEWKNWELEGVQKELVEAKNQADIANNTKSRFLANMSHEIRTPMNAIMGLAHITYSKTDDPLVKKNLERIIISTKTLLGIINDILDFSKIEAGKIVLERYNFDFAANIRRVVEMFEEQTQAKGISLELNIDENTPHFVFGDSLRIGQVLINIIGNAVKFTAAGGVTVSVSSEPLGSNIDRHFIAISDTGAGIDPDGVKKIFEPFSQADSSTTRKFGGTGLGLSISRKLVELMNGDIKLESTLKKGSVFTVILDLERGETDEESIKFTNDTVDKNISFAANIVLAEDNEINRIIAREILQNAGLSVVEADNGLDAVKLALSGECDLVLMDIQMPVMDGFEATRNIRILNKDIPVIAMTAHAMSGDKERCLDAGMTDYISKPFDPDDLINKIAKYITGKSIKINKKRDDTMGNSDLPEISIQDGLKRVNNNVDIYLRMLMQYVQDYKDASDRLKILLVNKDEEALKKFIHSLKGVTGSIGAMDIMETCRTLEQKIRDNDNYSVMSGQLVDRLSQLIDSINKFIDSNKRDVGNKSNGKDIKQIIAELKSDMINDRYIEEDNVSALRDAAGDNFDLIEIIDKISLSINSFDYNESIVLLDMLTKKC